MQRSNLISVYQHIGRLTLAALLLACWHASPAHAAPETAARWSSLSHTSFTHQAVNGAGGNNAFAQDHNGFIWLGTQTGLVRWDGYRQRRYAADNQNPTALQDGFIISLHIDPRGRLWIGTSSGGLARYDASQDNFVTYPAGPAGVSHARVSALAGDGAGGIWIGTAGGLDHMGADGVLKKAGSGAPAIAAADLPEGGIDALLQDHEGALWIGTRVGLFRRKLGAAKPVAVALDHAGDKPPSINALLLDSAGRIWAGTRNAGALVVDQGTDVARAVRESGADPALQRQRVFSIVEVSPDEVWLGTEGAGIVVVNPDTGATRRIRRQQGSADGLFDNDVGALFRDRSGIIFVATPGAMSQYDPHPKAILTLRESGAPLDGNASIPSMLMRPDGRLWVGVAGGGINIIDPLAGGVGQLRPGQPRTETSLPSGRVLAMANSPDNAVYIGTQQGLFRSAPDGARIERVAIPERSAEATIWAMAFQQHALWFGGLDGIWQIALDAGQPARLLRHEADGLGDTRVTALLPAPDGTLWIGTRAGLARLPAGGKVERIATDAADGTSLPPGYVSSLLIDRHQRLWVSIYGIGIAVLEQPHSAGRLRFRRLGTADGLPPSGVNALQQDRQGMIWASTDEGLARIDPDTFKAHALGSAEGVKIATYWTNSSAASPQGELLFGGQTGLTVVRPERLTEWTYQAPLVVTDVWVNDVPIPSAQFNHGVDAGGPGAATIQITPAGRERGFALEFAALDYSAPERNRYAYRLVGFDKDWINTDATLRRVSYNNLPPGDYTLQLRGSNRNGAWSPPLEVAVRALPLWHQQSWLRLLAALAGALALVGLVHMRTAYLRRRQRELQDMVDVRTAELQSSQMRLEVMAYADPLTGLPNRRRFNDDLRYMGARAVREHDSFTLLLIDLDHFKQINDTLGHDAGDALLVEAAKRLTLAVRESDRVARLGGDEFAVLLPHTGKENALAIICDRIVASMAEPIPFEQHQMRISASVGAATFTIGKDDLDALYKDADLALYAAKSAGRNGWRLHGDAETLA
jgi:diguanylate cyclase (GGDEF)-like protein